MKVLDYRQIFTSKEREDIYRDWYRKNEGGTLRQFQIYLTHYENAKG